MINRLYQMYLRVWYGWWLFFTTAEWWKWVIEHDKNPSTIKRFYERLNGGSQWFREGGYL